MKVTLYMAMSLNGIIADKKGNEDFLSDENWRLFKKKAEEVGCFIVGRKTYEIFTKSDEYNFNKIKCKKIVVSKNKKQINDIIAVSPEDAINISKKLKQKNVLLIGGSGINSSFFKKNFINEIIINVEPALVGEGIGLFSAKNFYKKLKLIKITKNKNIIQINYEVKK